MKEALFFVLISYLIGSFPTAYVICRLLKGIDIRSSGSGNVGATNVARVVGKGYGALTLLLDVLKGFLPVFICGLFCGGYVVLSGAAVIAGHIWPVFLRFKGGKGVAAGIGVIIALNYIAAIAVFVLFFIILCLTRFVSVGSIVSAAVLPVVMWYLDEPLSVILFTAAAAVVAIYTHRENIKRLLKGTENKFSFSKKTSKGVGSRM